MPTRAPVYSKGDGAGGGRRILVLFAHPSLDRSEANRPLTAALAPVPGVTLVDLYAEYPTFEINVDREQERLLRHEVICFMHPLYWYSTPAILKEWQDLVLEHGFAYGAGASALHGKLFFNALTAGGPEPAYRAIGYNHFTIRELLCPLEQMARLCGMVYLPPFALFGARTALEEGRMPRHAADWVRVLEALRDDRLDIAAAVSRVTLNADLATLIRGYLSMDGMLFHAFVYLAAAVLAVPVANRLGLGSVLGYLIAGILIGPALGLVGAETHDVQQVAEFGVVMMLFLVGLELEPQLLWDMRLRLLGLGGLQVGLTALLIAGLALALGRYWGTGLAIGLVFAMSSTAIVLQTLSEKGLTKTEGGRASFAVLLFQDIAVIAVLALIPLLARPGLAHPAAWWDTAMGLGQGGATELGAAPAAHGTAGLVAGLPDWGYALVLLGAVAAVVLGGHYLSRPLFRYIAESRLREVFTASALLLVTGIALLMTLVGLSPALGTFLAGVVLANSEFRHELQSAIEPFKGLLMGLFFITVGAGIDFGILSADFTTVLGLTLAVMGLKAVVLLGLAWLFRLQAGDRWLFALSLAQAGEFGFVLLGFCVQNGVIPTGLARTLSLVVALSMLLTPALFILYERLIAPWLRNGDGDGQQPDTIDELGSVVIAGIGRFGQVVNSLLVAAGVRTVVLDHRADQIDLLRKLDIKSYYGDASRPDLLHAAGIAQARLFIIAIDDRERAVEMVEYVRRTYPQVRILARAYDVGHMYLLKKAGANLAVREVYDGSLSLGAEALRRLGFHPYKVERMARAFRRHQSEGLAGMYELWDEDPDIARNLAVQAHIRAHVGTLQDALNADRRDLHDRSERGWTPPPKGFTRALDEDAS